VTILAVPAASVVGPGILGFLVVAGMALALVFLLRSLNKQLRKVVSGPRWRERAPGRTPAKSAQAPGTSPDPEDG
jgi:hypothetical protein